MVEDRIIVLKKLKYGESDLIVQGINPEGARLHFLAKSALKSKKRFGGGVLDPTHYIQVWFKEKPGEESLNILNDAKVINDFQGLRSSFEKLEAALYFLKLMNKVSQTGDVENHNNFNLLGNALKMAQTSESLEELKLLFEIKFLHYQGVLAPTEQFRSYIKTKLKEHEQIKLDRSEKSHLQRAIQFELNQFFEQ